ncbi:Tob55 [Angomonas deanei]|nr:Tob55 [Angomonas deanei]|eukprot:EPY37408.1 Tob55 [Angomonas deanei]
MSEQEAPISNINISEHDLRAALKLNVRTHVRVSGLNRTHPKVMLKELEAVKRCSKIEDVVISMEEIKKRWLELGVFKEVNYNIEPTADGAPNNVCVHIDVREANAKKSVGIFTTETSLPEITMSLENVLGGRYSVKGNYIPPAARVHSIALSFLSNVPFIGQGAEYYVGRRTENKTYHLANAEKIEEVKATASNQKPGMYSHCSVGIQRRKLVTKHRESVPEDLLPDFSTKNKGYIKYEFNFQNVAYHANPALFNMYPLPIYGTQVFSESELACGGESDRFTFLKSEFQFSKFWPLGPFFSVHWGSRVGGIYPFFQSRIPLNDRLFLSTCHVRGFKSIGPSTADAGETERFAATGGNAMWASSLCLNFPFLFAPNNGLAAMHLFANAGNNRMISSYDELKDVYTWFRNCACSIGAGITITRIPLFGVVPSGRFELNACLPIGIDKRGDLTFRNGNPKLFDNVRFGLVWSSNLTS